MIPAKYTHPTQPVAVGRVTGPLAVAGRPGHRAVAAGRVLA